MEATLKSNEESSLKETENFKRFASLVMGPSKRAVRVLFEKEFPDLTSALKTHQKKLLDLKNKHVINTVQWDLIFPKEGVANSKTFDVTLMICLIRSLSKNVAPPATGFDKVPSSADKTPGADLARIKYYRNYLAHINDNKICDTFFSKAWSDISEAVVRLGGQSLKKECEDLLTNIPEQYYQEIRDEVDKMKDEIEKLALKVNYTFPQNIREHMKKKLDNWKEDDTNFVETRASNHLLQCIQENSCVTVTASSGVGKTFTVRHVALQMMVAHGYDILSVTNPEDIEKYHIPDSKTLFVIDDLCGTYTLNQTYFDKWKTTHGDIKQLLTNYPFTKIMASCRLQIYQDEQFKLLPLFAICECNMSQNMPLSKNEKKNIAKKYLEEENVDKINEYIDLFDFFPLLCKLYNPTLNVQEFFKNPFSVYEKEIDMLNTEKAYGKYCALVLCVTFNNHLEEKLLTDDVSDDIKQIIKNTCDASRLNRGTSRLVLKDELDSLIHTFLKKEQGCYRTIHDKLFDFLCSYFGKKMPQCIIQNGDRQLISERFLFKKQDESDHFTTIVPDKYHKLYIERMLKDWSKGEVVTVFANNNMKIPEFRNTFLMYLKNLDVSYQKKFATTRDNAFNRSDDNAYDMSDDNAYEISDDNVPDISDDISSCIPVYFVSKIDKTSYISDQNRSIKAYKHDHNVMLTDMHTPLLQCSALGDKDMVEWCCSCDADVNICTINGESPLYIACKRGYTDIVKMLLNSKADINKCAEWEESPLFKACERGYTEIVKMLVNSKADVNKCAEWGESPLYIACKGGYTDIVTMLVDNKADINKCTDQEQESPLYKACKGGYTDIVAKLVENKADINKCTKLYEQSPLHIACKQGSKQLVEILISKGADYTKCDKNGESPLDIARNEGYDEIVNCITKHSSAQ